MFKQPHLLLVAAFLLDAVNVGILLLNPPAPRSSLNRTLLDDQAVDGGGTDATLFATAAGAKDAQESTTGGIDLDDDLDVDEKKSCCGCFSKK